MLARLPLLVDGAGALGGLECGHLADRHAPSSESWWDVPVSEVSTLDSTRDARAVYERWKAGQHPYLTPSDPGCLPGPALAEVAQ